MSSMSSEMDILRENQRKEVEYLALGLFCPKCKKKHPLRECLLDKVEACQIYELDHDTKEFPSPPKVKEIL